MQTVLRSDPDGIDLMHSYPDIADDPGLEKWHTPDTWSADRVFADMQKWSFPEASAASSPQVAWDGLKQWHNIHPLSSTVTLGQPLKPSSEVAIPTCPTLSWSDMWKIIAPGGQGSSQGGNSSSHAANPERAFLNPLSKRPDREHLSQSRNVTELNRVRDSHNTRTRIQQALLSENSEWESYLEENLNKPKALFMLRLEHREGELALGLGRRTFNSKVDIEGKQYEMEWYLHPHPNPEPEPPNINPTQTLATTRAPTRARFERKNKKKVDWGKRPGFQLAKVGYRANRQSIYWTTTENSTHFLPVKIVTYSKFGSNEPILSEGCLAAIREFVAKEKGEGKKASSSKRGKASSSKKSEEEDEDEEDEDEDEDEGDEDEEDEDEEDEDEDEDEEESQEESQEESEEESCHPKNKRKANA